MNRRNFFKLLATAPAIPLIPKKKQTKFKNGSIIEWDGRQWSESHHIKVEKAIMFGTPGRTGIPLLDLYLKHGHKISPKIKFSWKA